MLTLGTTYFNNPDYLLKYIDRNISFVDELIVVDDGSEKNILDYVKPNKKLRIFRVKQDYGFNSHGCRNLIMKKTTYHWVILMDIDREFLWPEEAYHIIKNKKLDPRTLYRFNAHSRMGEAHVSVNDYLIHKDYFFSAGGYDEEIIGERWGDREYFEQLKHFGKEYVLAGVDMMLTRAPSSFVKGDSKSVKDKPFRTNIESYYTVMSRIKKPNPCKPILTFEWEEITK